MCSLWSFKVDTIGISTEIQSPIPRCTCTFMKNFLKGNQMKFQFRQQMDSNFVVIKGTGLGYLVTIDDDEFLILVMITTKDNLQ